MAEVFVPQQPFLSTTMTSTCDRLGHASLQPNEGDQTSRDASEAFMFPAHSSLSPPSISQARGSTATGSFPRSLHRQRPSNISISALPPFKFDGSGNSPTRPFSTSPSRSPVRLTPPVAHSSGHKRGGSEFVGGAIAGGGPVLVSTSPNSNEEVPIAPPSPPKGPPSARRGHAHRRSGAVSQSDIKMIIQPSSDHRIGSAPSTPSEPTFRQKRPPAPERSNSQPGRLDVIDSRSSPPPPTRLQAESIQSRSRVGFSDIVEVIPRPLSTISSETSSSMSTVRASHSVSDSLGSIASGGTSSPPSAQGVSISAKSDEIVDLDMRSESQEAEYFNMPIRVGVAGSKDQLIPDALEVRQARASVDGAAAYDESDIPHSDGTDIHVLGSVPQLRATVRDHCDDPQSGDKQQYPSRISSLQHPRPRTSPEPKLHKHRVKSWADSLRNRKERRVPGSVLTTSRPLSTPAPSTAPYTDFSLEDVNFDDDTTCIIREPSVHHLTHLTLQTKSLAERSEASTATSNADTPAPMIDLDAAFEAQSPHHNSSLYDSNERQTPEKRRFHSSRDAGAFSFPSMNLHRRTESAPEMEPFDKPSHGFLRTGSNSAIGEAIEEEEEDVDQDATRRDHYLTGLGVNIVESESMSKEPIRRRRSEQSAAEDKERGISRAATPPGNNPIDPVEIADTDDEPRFSVLTKSSDESTITPTSSVDLHSPNPTPLPLPLDSTLPTPCLTYGTTPETPSAVSSAEYTKTSFDVRDLQQARTHTASSSITDRLTLDSSKAGDYSAASVDDVPSLTSSASTMFSSHPTRFSSSANTTSSADRSTSISAAVAARTRPSTASKRSSLASLSRLVGGPYNRSKLNIEETLIPDSPEKPDKKKRHRISRMMTFWKSKEKHSAA